MLHSSVVVSGHSFKHVKRAEILQKQTISYKQAASSIPKVMKHLKNSNYYRMKKNSQSFAFSLLFQHGSEKCGKNKAMPPFFSPHVVNKSVLFDSNVNTTQTLLSARCKLFI